MIIIYHFIVDFYNHSFIYYLKYINNSVKKSLNICEEYGSSKISLINFISSNIYSVILKY